MLRNLKFSHKYLLLLVVSIAVPNYSQSFKQSNIVADSIAVNQLHVKPDSTKKKHKRLIPLNRFNRPLDNGFFKLKKEQFYLYDYRYLGDIFNYIPSGFIQDLGWLGQPNEVLLYGLGNGNITYQNGLVSLNNRFSNSLNLNLLQSEGIDSIFITPLYIGFIYNLNNNPVTSIINFQNEFVATPYSRIRYYQASSEETFVDAIFKTRIYPNLYGQFEVTNNSIDVGFKNNDFTSWKVHTSLRYLLNESFNIVGDYSFVNQYVGLFGGVNKDSILNIEGLNSINDILYNRIEAPVDFKDRYQKTKRHNFQLSLLTKLGSSYFSTLDFYYQFHLSEFREDEKNNDPKVKTIFDNNKFKTLGLSLNQSLTADFLNINIISNYEQTEYKSPLIVMNNNITSFSVTGVASSKFYKEKIKPSLFIKYLNYDNKAFIGIGGSISFVLTGNLNLYGGFSSLTKPLPPVYFGIKNNNSLQANEIEQKLNLFEIGLKFKYSFFDGCLKYFNYQNNNEPISILNSLSETPKSVYVLNYHTQSVNSSGISLTSNIKIWKILFESTTSFYFNKNESTPNNLPGFTFRGGIYFKGFLFENNLDLKSGLNFQFASEQNGRSYDFERGISSIYISDMSLQHITKISKVPAYFSIDFFTAGKIQKRAIVYFVIENLLDTKYYIVPYYPKQERGLRIGISWEFLN